MDKMHVQHPLRPILGGTKNGSRLERYSYWRTGYANSTPPYLDFWVTQAGEYHSEKMFVTGNHEFSQCHQFYYHLAGVGEVTVANRSFTLSPGDLIIFPQGVSFSYYASKGIRLHWFAIEGTFPLINSYKGATRLSIGHNQLIATTFILMRETLIAEQPGNALRAVSLVYELFSLLEAVKSPDGSEAVYPDTVRVGLTYIRENYQDPFSAKKLATICGVTAPHLRTLFQKWVGGTPHQYHTRQRIEMAERLLISQDLAVREVATQVGYADPYYFSRVFKKLTGMQPSRYRMSILSNG